MTCRRTRHGATLWSRRRCAAAATVLALCMWGAGARAQVRRESAASDRLIQSVDDQRSEDGWLVTLRLSTPFRYVRHAPRGRADSVLIELQALGLERDAQARPEGRETLRPFPGPGGPPVGEISTRPTAGAGRVIEVDFRGEQTFDVTQGDDLSELQIRISRTTNAADEARAARLLQVGGDALSAGDYERAIQIYTKVLSLDAPSAHPEAREMLGLARERNGQRAHARREYAAFLEAWPDHPDADRVRQRLQALATSGVPPEPEESPGPATPTRRVPRPERFDLHGSLASYYSRGEFYLDDGIGDQVTDSSWVNDLYLHGRMRTRDFELEASGSGRFRFDFEGDDVGSDSRLNALLLEASQRGRGFWARVGRQRGGGGITGRFDGARIGYRPNDWLDLQLLGGFPLKDYASDDIDTDRFQVGGVIDVLDLFSLFDLELYTNYQNEDDLTYRAALGAQLRHLREGRALVATLDYDVYFNAVNIATVLADVQVAERLNLNTLIEYRKSPLLTLGNALIGQDADSISQLHDDLSASQMKKLAEDRSTESTTFTLGARYQLGDRFDLSGNATASRLGSTPGSGGVAGTPSTGWEFDYYAQIAGQALLMDRGVSVLGLRYHDGDRVDSWGLLLNGRYPLYRNLRLNPILRVDYLNGDDDLLRFAPRVRVDYTWWDLVLDLDLAFETLQGIGGASRPNEYGYTILVGVRYDF